MKALITGGGGFIGRSLVNELQKDPSIEVHILSRLPLKDLDGVVSHIGDVRKSDEVDAVFSSVMPDWVFHLAGDTRLGTEEGLFREQFETNTLGTLNVLSAATRAKAKAVVTVGTFKEYGDAPVPFDEDGPIKPVLPYGISKAAATHLSASFGKELVPATALRFPVAYGPSEDRKSFMEDVRRAIANGTLVDMTPGEQTRDFIHVEDVARALIVAAKNISVCRGEIINVCWGKEISLKDAIGVIYKITGKSDVVRFGALPYSKKEQMRYFGKNRKMKEILGFEPKITFEEGMRRIFALD